jgi:hypothetical protein
LKKLICAVFAAMMLSPMAFAGEFDNGFEKGVGLDVTILETSSPFLEEVAVESRYNTDAEEGTVMLVAKVNLWSALTGGK